MSESDALSLAIILAFLAAFVEAKPRGPFQLHGSNVLEVALFYWNHFDMMVASERRNGMNAIQRFHHRWYLEKFNA
jgi:hypothetical protein